MDLKEKIQTRAESYHNEIVDVRRHLHQHPELSYQEVETGKYIAQKLSEYGIPHEHGWADNGVVALIQGKNPEKKTVALRGDIDALPITESNEISYRHTKSGS